jgi:cellulose synthase/poly-beta-1,6-N-acetylglucosamine synthase-like glycosyltransferase
MSPIEALLAVVFWICMAAVAYVYAGYPLTLALRRTRACRTVQHTHLPSITVVIAAFNEAKHIEATVRNKLLQDYPAHLLDVIVVSDGSTDGTDDIVSAIGDPRVTLLRQEPRQGKTLALNRAIASTNRDIIVFSDANSRYEPSAVRSLASAFDDPEVGYVTGKLIYEDPGETAVGGGSGMYIAYENWLRRAESRVGSVVGVNGGIDAVRRGLYQPMRADHLPDLILPLRIVQAGYRVLYIDGAVAHESALGRDADEFKMRVRVILRALHALAETKALLLPRHGFFAFQLFAHKVLRYLVVIPLGVALLCSALLVNHAMFMALTAVQVACYGLAAIGWASRGRIRVRLVFVPFYFCLINVAAGAAIVGFLRGQRQVMWTPRKGA